MEVTSVLFLPYCLLLIILLLIILSRSSTLVEQKASRLMLVVVIVYFYYILITHASNAAFIDDYNLLDSYYKLLYSESLLERFKALFEQVNEHRFAVERLLMAVIDIVTGRPHVYAQILVGNMALLGIVSLFYRLLKELQVPIQYLIPVVLLLFSLLFYENAFWGIAAIQNTPLVLFALLTIYCLGSIEKNSFKWSIGCAILTSFTSGSGIAIWIVGVILLVFNARWRQLVVWVIIAACISTFYFTFDYYMIPKDREGLLTHVWGNVQHFLGFLGGLIYGGWEFILADRITLTTILTVLSGGFLVVFAFTYFIKRVSKDRDNRVFMTLIGMMLFTGATGLMLVVSRPASSNTVVFEHFMASRYLLFSVVFACVVYVGILILLRNYTNLKRAYLTISMFAALMLNIGSYYGQLDKISAQKAALSLDSYYTATLNGALFSSGEQFEDRLFWNHPTAFKDLLQRLKETGLYEPPIVIQSDWLKLHVEYSKEWKVNVTQKQATGFGNRYSPYVKVSVTSNESKLLEPRYMLFVRENDMFIIPATPQKNTIANMLKQLRYHSNEFGCEFRQLKFPAGTYQLFILGQSSDKQWQKWDTNHCLQIFVGDSKLIECKKVSLP